MNISVSLKWVNCTRAVTPTGDAARARFGEAPTAASAMAGPAAAGRRVARRTSVTWPRTARARTQRAGLPARPPLEDRSRGGGCGRPPATERRRGAGAARRRPRCARGPTAPAPAPRPRRRFPCAPATARASAGRRRRRCCCRRSRRGEAARRAGGVADLGGLHRAGACWRRRCRARRRRPQARLVDDDELGLSRSRRRRRRGPRQPRAAWNEKGGGRPELLDRPQIPATWRASTDQQRPRSASTAVRRGTRRARVSSAAPPKMVRSRRRRRQRGRRRGRNARVGPARPGPAGGRACGGRRAAPCPSSGSRPQRTALWFRHRAAIRGRGRGSAGAAQQIRVPRSVSKSAGAGAARAAAEMRSS